MIEIVASPIEVLCGKYANDDFLADLEAEHQQELRDEPRFVLDGGETGLPTMCPHSVRTA